MGNEIKILKRKDRITGIVINGQRIDEITDLKINNDYTPNETQESVIVKISNISSLEIISD